ncbi:Asp23/Gls24 family envelope stress response protein [Peptoniphilus stercorisuis]|uniref:Alkaline shock family protein YloU n=1 Tax=Peptoniphilus stercorisuis TaxID=1436965 RepID=A0ABS4KC34_9FIRM|nr:Asp23/Gls24 family envelope stress response protein [Peptoniphilus stercorisuis]MBP2025338.1 putative alkaline shock family protein YloU [Peptoniphilus stercorisuis]
MPANIKTESGSIVIDNNVLAIIAGVSAMESYGIVGMASKNAADGIFELLKFDNLSKGIKVNTEDGEINIELHVILEYGVRISTVGENIIDRVKFNITNLTGLSVNKIDVLVEGIRLK